MNIRNASLTKPVPKSHISTRELVLAGMFAAVLTIISQISVPMPSGIPITIQVFGVALIGTVLGWKLGTLSVLVYILLGAVGLPVFSNFHGGPGTLVGLTGGYIWSWPLMSLLCGITPHTRSRSWNLFVRLILALIGLGIVELIGGLQWAFLVETMSFQAISIYSLAAFVPKDTVLTIAAVILGLRIKKMIR